MAPAHSRLSNDLMFKYHSALKHADASKKEALWYGVWAWLLDNNIFREISTDLHEGMLCRTTVTYAQYPLTTDADTKEHDFVDLPPFPRLNPADVALDDEDDTVLIDDRHPTPPPTATLGYYRDTKGLSPESNDELDSLTPRMM
ncbi:hypothetical protein DXG03_001828 [Asterophora parasitica]|uniref:Uncharacterized protein n=1 Tax=Asterophora parasitica TaxID=117018 RepID=A0A9P7K8J6_9AGAR|nr:hypothetical protein DXG03_001828 [Asterophora parasitica]